MLRVPRRFMDLPRNSASQGSHSIRDQWRWSARALALTTLIVGIAILIVSTTGAEWRQLTSDSNALGGDPWYFGFMEVATSLILAAAAGVALFSSTMMRGDAKRFVLWAGVFTLLLSLDDIYMLHESISERSIYAVYAA